MIQPFSDIKLPEVLTKEEINKLYYQMKLNDGIAREKLIAHNIKLVIFEIKKRFSDFETDVDDLVSVGIIGLIKSVDTFQIDSKYEFTTYACKCIDNEILMYLRKQKNKINSVSFEKMICLHEEVIDINQEETISDGITIEELYIENEEYKLIRKIVRELPDYDRQLIELFFGFNGNDVHKQIEICKKLNMQKSTVSRNLKRIILDIKNKILENDNSYQYINTEVLKRTKQ